jgi:molybdopterin converting factor small subunit
MNNFIKIKVRYLGSLSIEITSEEEYIFDQEISLRDLLKKLLERHEKLERVISSKGDLKPGYMMFINEIDYQLIGLDYVFKESSEIVIMPISHGGDI